jgi:hypothetical protein
MIFSTGVFAAISGVYDKNTKRFSKKNTGGKRFLSGNG